MTTAARPTFEPARGGRGKGEGDLSAMSKQYSSRDLPSHTKLKHRQSGQGTAEETKERDFRKELEEKEKIAKEKKTGGVPRDAVAAAPSLPAGASSAKRPRIEGAAAGTGGGGGGGGAVSTVNLDADDPVDDDDDDDDDDDSDEDDTAELMAELQRIKKERASEKSKKEEEERVEQERIRTENILHGNPLLNKGANAAGGANPNFKVARRWDDDVVFKNCAKNFDKNKKEFINDSLRSEFHKKFMDKYIK